MATSTPEFDADAFLVAFLEMVNQLRSDPSNVDRDINYDDFNTFCDSYPEAISTQTREQIWKQLGAATTDSTAHSFHDSFTSEFLSEEIDSNAPLISRDDARRPSVPREMAPIIKPTAVDVDEHDGGNESDDEQDDSDRSSHELVLEFEIADHAVDGNDGNEADKDSPAISLRSPYNGLMNVDRLFRKYGTIEQGALYESELISLILLLYPEADEHHIHELFKLLDTENRGFFQYDTGDAVQRLQQKLDSYPRNMLSSSEFCSELKNVYCPHHDIDGDIRGETPTADVDRSALALAMQKKKELDYALSLESTDGNRTNSLQLIAQDLWKWIEDHGVRCFEEKRTLKAEMRESLKSREELLGTIEDYKQQIADTNRELASALRRKRQYSLSCESLQSELELMVKQLSQEQRTEDGSTMSSGTMRGSSLRELKRRNSRGILIESQSRLYGADGDGDRVGVDEDYFADKVTAVRHRRDVSMDIPNESILVKAFYRSQPATTDDESAVRYEMNHESMSNGPDDEEEEILSMREVAVSGEKVMDEIQSRMDKQEEKLDALIDLVQSVAAPKEPTPSFVGFRSLGVVLMSVVCLAGYSVYSYRRKGKGP